MNRRSYVDTSIPWELRFKVWPNEQQGRRSTPEYRRFSARDTRQNAGGISLILLAELAVIGVIVWGMTTAIPVIIRSSDQSPTAVENSHHDMIMQLQPDDGDKSLWIQNGIAEIEKVDLVTGKLQRIFESNGHSITFSCFSRDTKTFLVTLNYQQTMVYRDENVLFYERSFDNQPHCCALTPDGRKAVCITGGISVKLWDLSQDDSEQGDFKTTEFEIPQTAEGISVDPTGRKLFIAFASGELGFFDLATGKLLQLYPRNDSVIRGLSISDDGRWLAVNRCWSMALYDVESHETVWEKRADPENDHLTVKISPDGRWVTSVQLKSGIRFLDRETGDVIQQFGLPSSAIKIAFSAASDKLYLGNVGGAICVRSLPDWQEAPEQRRELSNFMATAPTHQ